MANLIEEESHAMDKEAIKLRILGKGVEDTGGDYVLKEDPKISPKGKVRVTHFYDDHRTRSVI